MDKLLVWARCPVPAQWANWYAIPLRIVVGLGFMQHGYAKLARGADSFTAILHALSMPMPSFLSWLTIAVELLGGLAVLVGLSSRSPPSR